MIPISTKVIAMAAIVVSLTAQGCGVESHSPTNTVDVSVDDALTQPVIHRDIAVRAGDNLRLSLGSNRSTPFSWRPTMKIGDPSVLRQTGHEYVAPSDTGGRVGVSGTEVWTFKARKAGTTVIATDYVTSGESTPACAFTATVKVQ
jgi:inhibitor of cysteine peptidase